MFCPRCQSLIDADDVNLEHLVAKCRHCHEVFSFADQIPASAQPVKLRVPQPERLRVEDDGERRRIVQGWFGPMFIFLGFFCVAWDGFLFFWYSTALDGGPWIMIVFPIAHVAAGIGLTYYTLAGLMNRTVLELHDGRLEVRHGPLPWAGNRRLEAVDIQQLYCDEASPWSIAYIPITAWNSHGNITGMVNLNVVLNDEHQVKLLGRLERGQALFYKQQLEEWLAIEPRVVPGAIG